jgi:uncharacterized peroxidase-related enzyme
MRLEIFDKKATLSARLIAQLVRFLDGFNPDLIRVLLYRKEFFGERFQSRIHDIMCGGTAWTHGERELIAAFVSDKNRCRYCTAAHRATASELVGASTAQALLDDPSEAPISDALRATLVFIETLTVSPRDVSGDDIARLRAAGVSEEQIERAVEVCVQFCVINRLADTFDVRMQTPRQLANEGKTLAKKKYKF